MLVASAAQQGTIGVLGAGVAGLAVATELDRRGATVRVADPEGGPGPHGCSWWAGGMLAPFCEGETAEAPVVRLGQEAAGWWAAQGVPVTRRGSLVVTLPRDRAELDRFARRTSGHRTIDGAQMADLEPALAGRFRQGLFFEGEAHIDPRAALGVLRDRLARRGAVISTASPGTEMTVDCRGLGARDTLADLRGVRGEMAVLRAPEVTLSRPVRLLHPRQPIYVVPRSGGVHVIGATQIETARRGPATVRSVVDMLGAAYALHPAFAEAEILELGADARPAFPDNLPRIRRRGGTIHVNGLFRHGFLLAPSLARMTAELLLDGRIPEVMDEDTDQR